MTNKYNTAKYFKKTQLGRSMVEMLGVLAIIGVLSVGGIAGYAKAMFKFKINKFNEQISEIITNIRTVYTSQSDFTDINSDIIRQLNIAPDDMYKTENSSSLTHVFGGEMYIGTAFTETMDPSLGRPVTTSHNNMFYVSVNSISQEACKSLLMSNWGNENTTGIIGLGVQYTGNSPIPTISPYDNASEYYAKSGDSSYPLPYTVIRANTACTPTTDATLITIFWYFIL
jgi:type II secretory pathway pseudopilin PulG